VLVFLVVVLASASGVMLFSYIDTRERQTEFALLRTLGSSSRQLNGVVWFSIFLVVVCSIGLGTWIGFQTAANLLPLLGTAEEGKQVVPPLVLRTNWTTLLVSYLVLAGVTAATVAWLAWISAKMEIQRALRIGDA
jgi:ABC-type antimicrobial peptide transport system permease subunit